MLPWIIDMFHDIRFTSYTAYQTRTPHTEHRTHANRIEISTGVTFYATNVKSGSNEFFNCIFVHMLLWRGSHGAFLLMAIRFSDATKLLKDVALGHERAGAHQRSQVEKFSLQSNDSKPKSSIFRISFSFHWFLFFETFSFPKCRLRLSMNVSRVRKSFFCKNTKVPICHNELSCL